MQQSVVNNKDPKASSGNRVILGDDPVDDQDDNFEPEGKELAKKGANFPDEKPLDNPPDKNHRKDDVIVTKQEDENLLTNKSEVGQTEEDESTKKANTVSYLDMFFRHADSNIKCMVIVGHIVAFVHGAILGCMPIVMGKSINDLSVNCTDNCNTVDTVKTVSLIALILGFGAGLFGSISRFCWTYITNALEVHIKKLYFKKILQNDMAWYDKKSPEKITAEYNIDAEAYVSATGACNSHMSYEIGVVISSFVVGFTYSVYLSLINSIQAPLLMASFGLWMWTITKSAGMAKEGYLEAGSVAEQSIYGIRTVKSQNGEEHEMEQYNKGVDKAKDVLVKYAWIGGIAQGSIWFISFFNYGFNFYISGIFIEKDYINPNTGKAYQISEVLICFFAIMTAYFSFGSLNPAMVSINKGREAAYSIFEIIESQPIIIENDQNKISPTKITGNIELKNIKFNYPSRPNIKVLNGLNIKIQPGQKVAFVGETGCGKSTLIQLIERFYDPQVGEVLIDDHNVKEYNLTGLRKFIGYVGQEPVLFAMSIKENLLQAKPDAKDEEIQKALMAANAWDFVQLLEKKIDTFVGVGGCQLSGGQKQRIAIARAILQNPSILLLDESTSAQDRKNEREIQETLDNFSKNRTTVTIAHRLQTIMNSDVIFVLEDGEVCEQGTHDYLMEKKGVYCDYVQKQEMHQVEQEKKAKSESDEIVEDAEIQIESIEKEIDSPKQNKQVSKTSNKSNSF